MATYFVSRHIGAVEWAERHGFNAATLISHFDPSVVQSDDVVIGTLPVQLAAVVCSNGGQYHHLILDIPADARGRELSANDMESFGATIQQFIITPA